MTFLKSLQNKNKTLTISGFSIISLLLLIPSALIAVNLCDIYSAIVSAVILMIVAIPFHCIARKYNFLYLISFILNSVANSLSVSAYYIHTGKEPDIMSMATAVVPSIIVLLTAVLVNNVFNAPKKCTMITSGIINAMLTISTLILWITKGNIVFSFAFFASIITLFYILVMGISVDHKERNVLRDISFGSFGSFVIVTVVVLFIISEGDIVADLGSVTPDTPPNKKKAIK